MTQSKITTVRFSIPTATNPESPVVVRASIPLPIIKSFQVSWNNATAQAANQILTGWRVSHGGGLLIPSQGYYDSLTNPGYAAFPYIGPPQILSDVNIQVQGTPYDLIFEAYNTGTGIAYAYFTIQSTPLIELPPAPVVVDAKKND